jgi:hypothetical protein
MLDTKEEVLLSEWEVVHYVDEKDKERDALRITGDDGSVGYFCGGCDEADLSQALPFVEGHNLLDHEGMYDRFCQGRVTNPVAHAWDLACWDLRARRADQPLWQLFGEKTRERAMMYGDVRWGWFEDVDEFANCVRFRVEEEGLRGVKLHLPGTWGLRYDGTRPPGLETTLSCLRAARQAVGDDVVLAYDPFNPEFFHFEEDLQVVDVLAECGYEWLEGGIPELPEPKWLDKYVELCEHAPMRIEPEGRWEPGYEPTADEVIDEDIGVLERNLRFAQAGGAGQFHYDMQACRGISAGLKLIEIFRSRPELDIRLNFHWNWEPHQHLLFATEPELWPYLETGSPKGVTGRTTDDGYLLPPDWVGVYQVPDSEF